MKHWSLLDKYNLIKNACKTINGDYENVGIHHFGLLHDIGDVLGMQGNSGGNLHSLWARITKIMRDLIKAGYPIKEYKIKSYSWSEKETWHSFFVFEDKEEDE